MKKYLHFDFIGLRRYILASILALACMSSMNSVHAQAAESYNDGGIKLKVWLHAVYSDANCSENIINGPTKFIYNNLKLRASNGTGSVRDNFPGSALNNFFPQDMRFRVKGKNTNSFWKVNNGNFRMLNPYYPFKESTYPTTNPLSFPGAEYMPAAASERAPRPPYPPRMPVGLETIPGTSEQGILMLDRTFAGPGAPDRYEWKIDEMFESDADFSGKESVMNIGGLGCNTTFGLPAYYEGKKGIFPDYGLIMNLLIVDSFGVSGVIWGTALGGCMSLFGFEIDPFNIFNIIAGAIGISDYDDSYASKNNFSTDPAFFRGTSANTVGYFTTQKVKATKNTDGGGEGYILVFAHQWEWAGADSGFDEPTGPVKIQRELCPDEQYTDGPITLKVWLDGYFTDGDHEGTDIDIIGEVLECSDISFGPQALLKDEEKYIRARATTAPAGMGPWSATIRNRVNRPDWINTNTQILNKTYSAAESGMNTFTYDIQSWESDCETESPSTCSICIIGGGSNCCILKNPFGSGCLIPGITISARDNKYLAEISGEVNWRNSAPFIDNYVYVPVKLSTSRYDSHLARLRYKWTIAPPKSGPVDGPRDVLLCPGETHTMSATNPTNATWYQWQYTEVNGPSASGPACPANPNWVDVPASQGGICPNDFTTQPFTGTRFYRMLVYNRGGDGSFTPNGEKFKYDSTVCTRITVLDSIIVPIDGPYACGTAANPTTVRAGSAITLRPVLPPAPGSTSIPGITYEWSATGGTVSPALPASAPWQTTLSFPSTSPTPVSVTLLTNVQGRCPTANNYDTTCYFITEDPGCSGTTGVIYVSNSAGPGGIGTINRPFNLDGAFALVAGDPNITHVKIEAGNYTIDSTSYGAMQLRDNLVVEGNYRKAFDASLGEDVYIKQSNLTTNITSNIVERITTSQTRIHTIGFRATGNNWILQDINITTGDAPERDALLYKFDPGTGLSNYAIHINNSTGWKIINSNARAGQAGKGSKGATPTESCPEAGDPALQNANSSGHPTLPGIGNNTYCSETEPRAGGNGGGPGAPGGTATYNLPPYGGGGGAGASGNTGRLGDAGVGVPGVANISELTGIYYPVKTSPSTPTTRGHVGGGGGGGGGGSGTIIGGAGGIGGLGGLPGYGSGAAFGIWVSGNSSGVETNLNPTVSNINAISGGDGGEGMDGYPGGLGGGGGGAGGKGGKGGIGGQGSQGGVGGFNINKFVSSNSSMTNVTPSYPPPRLESDYTSGCTNSRILIRKYGTADWGTISGLVYPDLTPTNGTTSDAGDNPKLIYYPTGALGAKNLETSSGVYQNQIYVRYERPMPTITVPERICYNTPIDLISTPGMADPIDHEWVIQENLPPSGIYTSPTPVYRVDGIANPTGIILPNTTGTSVFYQVRYRVRDNCCGWSIPIYSIIEVLPRIDNVIGSTGIDTSIYCNIVDPDIIKTNPAFPVPTGATWKYQWYQSFNGGPYTEITGATTQNYNPPILDSAGTYNFIRVIGSTIATCADTSNAITYIVTENFDNNFIDFPVPFIAECGPLPMPVSASASELTVAHIDVGLMNGSVPTGPGDANTFYYIWQKSIDTVSWTNISAAWPSEGGTLPVGTGTDAQSWDPATMNPAGGFSYGIANQIFPLGTSKGDPGHILFRRIVQRVPGDIVCTDTSNYVTTEVYPGRENWNACLTIAGPDGNSNRSLCLNNFHSDSAQYGYEGTCVIESEDIICPGSVTLTLPTVKVAGATLRGEQFAWYSVKGGPYNRFVPIGIPCVGSQCTNPMLSDQCFNAKPLKADFVTFAPYDSMTSITVVLDSTTTFYVNAVDKCFTDDAFRTSTNPEGYVPRWQRKTIIVVTPPEAPTDILASDTLLCEGIIPPDSIDFEIVGGDLGNDGQFVIYDTDPSVGGPHTPVFGGGTYNDTTGRLATLVRPLVTTTYYARVENRCDTTDYVTVTVNIDLPSTDPVSLDGPDVACDGETLTLTVVGGSLGTNAEWVLYNGDPLLGGTVISSNTTGIFNHSPSTDITYFVRAESNGPCPETNAVSHEVIQSEDCVCDADPGVIEYAPTGVTTIATVECESSDGWTYYAETSAPNIYLFAIQKTPGSAPVSEATGNTVPFNAICSLTVTANPTSPGDVFYAEDPPFCEGNFVMGRYWNVSFGGGTPAINGFVRTRFFFPPGELAATFTAANAWQATHNMGTCGLPLNTGPAQVFKTTDGTAFNPNTLSGKVPPVSDVLPTTINNFNYVAYLTSALPHGDTYPQTLTGKNYVQAAWDGFSGGGVAIRVSPDINVLPITILYFTGSMVEDQVYLNWETASELNNDYFVVEKSADIVNWTDIGSVDGNGTTNEAHKYQLIDGQPYNGKNYYRLRQVDFDGTVSYSRVIVIEFNNTKTVDNSFTVLPNPTSGPIVATIVSSLDQQVNMRILDISGKLMGNKDITLGKGVNSLQLDLTKYPAATYILSYTDKNGQEYTAKVVKQ